MSPNLKDWWRRNSWPAGIFGIIGCFFIGDGILVFTVLSDKSFGAEENYYEKGLHHDEARDATLRAKSAGWSAYVTVGAAPIAQLPRPVDVRVTDGTGRAVSGLTGSVAAVRPSDVRLRSSGELIAVPGEDGLYRLLLKVPVTGLWEFEIVARKSGQPYRMVVRQDVKLNPGGEP